MGAINGFMGRLADALAALRRFTGNASHQIRTPLAIIRTQIELARRARDPQEMTAALDVADAAVAQSERTLAQLLLLARVDEASADRLTLEELDLCDLARTVTAELEPLAARAGLDLGFEVVPDAQNGDRPLVRGQRMLFAELLRNLIENAIAYAGRGRSATVRVGRGDSGQVLLDVEDDGPGIPERDRGRALKRFERLTSEDGPQGAGLGLAIVDEIARLMGARVELIPSDPTAASGAMGLTVRIVFPRSANERA